MNRMIAGISIMCAVFLSGAGCVSAHADDLAQISKQIIDAPTGHDVTAVLESARALYLKENDYNGLVDFLQSLSKKKKGFGAQFDYYTALTRYQQLRFLEERQLWDEYFSRGNEYREDIVERATRARTQTETADPVHVKAQGLLWQFHHFQQDAFVGQALEDLMKDVEAYAGSSKDTAILKDIADILAQAEERSAAKRVYDLYIRGLASTGLSDEEYVKAAKQFLTDGNRDLAESMYDVYREKIAGTPGKEPAAVAASLIGVAMDFAYGADKQSDPAYAEAVFAQASTLRPVETWEETTMYARAYNAEKMKEFALARQLYQLFLKTYPASALAGKARYKSGLIAAFALGDIEQARTDFNSLSDKSSGVDQFLPESLYQMGMLAQWEGDASKAQAFYSKAAAHGAVTQDTALLIKKRLQEIKEGKGINDNLKTFLDITYGPDRIMYTMSKAQLTCSPAAVLPKERIGVRSEAMIGSTGCFAVGLQYLWSGHLGDAQPGLTEDYFTTAYADKGVKEVFLVVVSPTGIVDRAFDIVDVE